MSLAIQPNGTIALTQRQPGKKKSRGNRGKGKGKGNNNNVQGNAIQNIAGKAVQAALQQTRANVNKAKGPARAKAAAVSNTAYLQAVEAITMPINKLGFRWGSKYNEQPTATANLFSRPNVGFAKGGTLAANSVMPTTDCMGLVTRIAECGAILYDQNTSAQTFKYNFTFKGGAAADVLTYDVIGKLQLDDLSFKPLPIIQGTSDPSMTYEPHGHTMYAGAHPSKPDVRFVWLNASDLLKFTWTNNSAGTSAVRWQVWKCDSEGDPVANTVATSAGIGAGLNITVTAVNATYSGYYGITLGCTTAQDSTISAINITGGQACFCHRAIPGYAANILKIDATRIIGASIMATNNASITGMQGKLIGVQLPKDTNWMDFVGDFDKVSTQAQAVQMSAYNGIYGYLKPSHESDFEFKVYHETNGTVVTDSFWPILYQSDSLLVYLQVTSTEGQDFYWTTSYALEYKTNDQFPSLGVSSTSEAANDRALEQIKVMQQWFENPLHVAKIMQQLRGGLKKVSSGIQTAVPMVGRAVGKYGPLALQLAGLLAAI
jgi:hypothetical protein